MKNIKIASNPAPPAHLSERSKDLWCELGPRRVENVGRQTLFLAALECLDRADTARRAIDAEGLITVTKRSGLAHVHPLVRVEHEARAQFARLWQALGLQSYNHITFS